MPIGPQKGTIEAMRPVRQPKRYVLVPRTANAGPRTPEAGATPGGVKRYSLARVGVSPRSALGEDRHQRLERAAGHDRA
jgi:hypothetical protein